MLKSLQKCIIHFGFEPNPHMTTEPKLECIVLTFVDTFCAFDKNNWHSEC